MELPTKEDLRRRLRENLRRLREEAGYSQEQVARFLNVNRATYTYYETGKTTPSVDDVYLLSRLYGRTMEDLLAETP